MRILETEVPSGGYLFACEDGKRSYAHRTLDYVGDEVFLAIAKEVGEFQLSIKKWCDSRDGGSKILARDLSASVWSQRAELRRVEKDWFGDDEPSDVVRKTVDVLWDCRVLQGPNLDDGPLQVELGGEPACFLVAMQTTALVAHFEGKIDLELLLKYLAACFYGVLLILSCLFKFYYFDADGTPRRNALGLHVLKFVLKSQLVEFKLVVFNGMVIVQRQTETVPLGIGVHVGRFQAVAGLALPTDWNVHNIATADDDDGVDGPPVPGALSHLGAPTISTGGVETYMLEGALGTRSSVVTNWEQRFKNSIDEALGDPVLDVGETSAERAHLRELSTKGVLPPWLPTTLFQRPELKAHLLAGFERCASLARAERVVVDEDREVAVAVWLRAARADTREMPGILLRKIPMPHQLIFKGCLATTLAAYWALSMTPIFLLMCIVNTMRWRWDADVPPDGVTPNGRFDIRTFRFYEPSPKNLLWFLVRIWDILVCWWPALKWGLPYKWALYYVDTGELVPNSEATRRGTTLREPDPVPRQIVMHSDATSQAYLGSTGPEHVLDVECLRPCLRSSSSSATGRSTEQELVNGMLTLY